MARISGGTFRTGYSDFYPEEQPVRTISVDGIGMDEHALKNAGFRCFVKVTGYAMLKFVGGMGSYL